MIEFITFRSTGQCTIHTIACWTEEVNAIDPVLAVRAGPPENNPKPKLQQNKTKKPLNALFNTP